jgi:hypothetical protein
MPLCFTRAFFEIFTQAISLFHAKPELILEIAYCHALYAYIALETEH